MAPTSSRRELLPQLAAGDIRMAISVTEPGAGTDVLGGMKTVAKKVDGGYRITGSKIWSTAAHVSQYLLLLARTQTIAESRPRASRSSWCPTRPRDCRSGRSPRSACVRRLVRGVPRRRVRAREVHHRRARPRLVPDAGDAEQRAHPGRRPVLRDHRRRARGRGRVPPGARGRSASRSAQSRPCSTTSPTSPCGRRQAELVTYYAAWKYQDRASPPASSRRWPR